MATKCDRCGHVYGAHRTACPRCGVSNPTPVYPVRAGPPGAPPASPSPLPSKGLRQPHLTPLTPGDSGPPRGSQDRGGQPRGVRPDRAVTGSPGALMGVPVHPPGGADQAHPDPDPAHLVRAPNRRVDVDQRTWSSARYRSKSRRDQLIEKLSSGELTPEDEADVRREIASADRAARTGEK